MSTFESRVSSTLPETRTLSPKRSAMGLFQQPALGFFGDAKRHGADSFNLGLQHVTGF